MYVYVYGTYIHYIRAILTTNVKSSLIENLVKLYIKKKRIKNKKVETCKL